MTTTSQDTNFTFTLPEDPQWKMAITQNIAHITSIGAEEAWSDRISRLTYCLHASGMSLDEAVAMSIRASSFLLAVDEDDVDIMILDMVSEINPFINEDAVIKSMTPLIPMPVDIPEVAASISRATIVYSVLAEMKNVGKVDNVARSADLILSCSHGDSLSEVAAFMGMQHLMATGTHSEFLKTLSN